MAELDKAWMWGDHRIYDILQDDGTISSYPSVTTLMHALPESDGLKWFRRTHEDPERHTATRAMIGSTCHYYFESRNARMLPDHVPEMEDINFREYLTLDAHAAIKNINLKIKLFMMKHEFKPWWLERPLWSDQYGYAGRVDYIGEFDGVSCILDLKTSKRFYPPENGIDKHALQLSMYKIALKERLDIDIEELIILRVNEANKPELKYCEFSEEDVADLRDLYRNQYGR
jgi:hypothetical protein